MGRAPGRGAVPRRPREGAVPGRVRRRHLLRRFTAQHRLRAPARRHRTRAARRVESLTGVRVLREWLKPLLQANPCYGFSSGNGSRMSDSFRSEEHTSELQSLMRISYAVFCLKKKTTKEQQ